jgi:hypothetical protein
MMQPECETASLQAGVAKTVEVVPRDSAQSALFVMALLVPDKHGGDLMRNLVELLGVGVCLVS